MKIFSLVSGCRIAWQEQGAEHRVRAGEGERTWEEGGGGGEGAPQGRLQWPVAISHLAWWLVSPAYHLGQEETQHGPQAELPLLTDAQTDCRHTRPCLPCRPSVPHAMHTRNTRIHEENPPGRSSGDPGKAG